MRTAAALLLTLALSASAQAASYTYLETLPPAYEYANVTWPSVLGSMPDLETINCWLFSTPSLSLMLNNVPYMIQYNAADAASVANAWCTLQGFDSATDSAPAEIPVPASTPFNLNTIDVATGKTSTTGVGFKFIECGRNGAVMGCSAQLPSKSGSGNRGYMNDGSNNFGNFNSGSNNYGDWNTGSNNYGSFNIGSSNKGSYNKASNCVGDDCTMANQQVNQNPLL